MMLMLSSKSISTIDDVAAQRRSSFSLKRETMMSSDTFTVGQGVRSGTSEGRRSRNTHLQIYTQRFREPN